MDSVDLKADEVRTKSLSTVELIAAKARLIGNQTEAELEPFKKTYYVKLK
jgi:hypothetical protein